jgi:hypothetical protein
LKLEIILLIADKPTSVSRENVLVKFHHLLRIFPQNVNFPSCSSLLKHAFRCHIDLVFVVLKSFEKKTFNLLFCHDLYEDDAERHENEVINTHG